MQTCDHYILIEEFIQLLEKFNLQILQQTYIDMNNNVEKIKNFV